MRRPFAVALLSVLGLLYGVTSAKADVDVRLGFGGRGYYGPRYGYGGPRVVVTPGYYADPYYYPPVYAPPPVYVAPEQPGYAATPQDASAQPTDGTAVPLSGDYGTDLGTLNGKLSKIRGLLKHQKDLGGLTNDQFTSYSNQVEAIEKEEHTRSYNNNGRLTDQDFAELIGRTNELRESINESLSQ